jgi:two-component system CheB/CheR fusion protein
MDGESLHTIGSVMSHRRVSFPVVGLGASAGGLRSLIAFFDALPPEPGMAFVLVQHLAPDH